MLGSYKIFNTNFKKTLKTIYPDQLNAHVVKNLNSTCAISRILTLATCSRQQIDLNLVQKWFEANLNQIQKWFQAK